MPIIGTPLPGSNPGPLGGGGGGDEEDAPIILATAMTLDIWTGLQNTFGAQGGTPAVWRPYPQRHWDAVSLLIEARMLARGPVFDIRDYATSAIEPGDDATDAILAAYAAAAFEGGGVVFIPRAGNDWWYFSDIIPIESPRVSIEGIGPASRLRMSNGANLATGIRLGYATSTTSTAQYTGLANLLIDGNYSNQTGGTALVVASNAPDYTIRNVVIQNAYATGFLEDTESATAASSRSSRATIDWLDVLNCGRGGVAANFALDIKGSKNSRYDNVNVRSNANGGARFMGAAFTGNKELTQCQFNGWFITDNGNGVDGVTPNANGIGLVLDNTTRNVLDEFTITFNVGGGIEFRRTLGTSGFDGTNYNEYGHFELRNNGILAGVGVSGLRTQNSGDLGEAQWSVLEIQNQTEIADQKTVFIEGCTGFRCSHMGVRLGPSLAVHLKNCTSTQISKVRLHNNGSATPSAVLPHGLWIEGGSGTIDDLLSNNAKTNSTHGGYELYMTGLSNRWKVGHVDLNANADGYEVAVEAGDELYVKWGDGVVRASTQYTPAVAIAASAGQTITLPPEASIVGCVILDGTAGASSIAAFTAMPDGTTIRVAYINGANVTITHGTIKCNGGADIVGTANKLVTLTWMNGGVCYAMDGAV